MSTSVRPHVVVVSPTALVGGAERSLLALIEATRRSLAFTLVVPDVGPVVEQAARAGARVVLVPWPHRLFATGERARGGVPAAEMLALAPGVAGLVARLRRALAALGPDVVVTNGIKAHVLGALATPAGIPLVWYAREGLEGRPRSTRLLAALSRRASGVVAISGYVAREMVRVVRPGVPVTTLPNLIDLDAVRPGLALPPDLVKEAGERWVGVVGALTPLKGQDVLLEAAAEVLPAAPRARILIVGAASYASEASLGFEATLRRQAAASPLAGRVRFLGERADATAIIANLDVLVHPCRGPEGLGRAILEAMACAVPVITTNRWGPAELITHGEHGFTCPPDDPGALAAHLATLLADPAARQRLGEAGRRRAAMLADRAAVAARFTQLVRAWAAARHALPPLPQLDHAIGR